MLFLKQNKNTNFIEREAMFASVFSRLYFICFVLYLSQFLFLSCAPREAGPHKDEHGKVFYWHLYKLKNIVSDDCSMEQQRRFKEYTLNSNDYFVYQLLQDGSAALALECTSFSAQGCVVRKLDLNGDNSFDDPIVMPIKEHHMEYRFPDRISKSQLFDCEHHIVSKWAFTDLGDEFLWSFKLSHRFIGDELECNLYRERINLEVSEEKNIAMCEILQNFTGELHSIVESPEAIK